MRASGRFGDPATVVVVPSVVNGSVTVGGAVAGEPSIAQSEDGLTVTVYPAGGVFTVNVATVDVADGLHVPLTTTRYCLPLSPANVAAVV